MHNSMIFDKKKFHWCCWIGFIILPIQLNASTPPPRFHDNLPQAFDHGIVYQQELYVDSSAASGGDGSPAAPFNNIRDGLLNTTQGTRVNVAAGNYAPIGFLSNIQGTLQAPIALVGNGIVTIDGSGTSQVLQLSDARYLVLENIQIRNSFPHGINIDDGSSYDSPSDFVVLRKVSIGDIGNGSNNDCLKMSGVNNFYIEASEFFNCNQGEAIDMVGCHDGVITANRFHTIPRNAVQTKGGSADILIHGNRFENVAQRSINAGGSTGLEFFRPIDASFEAARIQMVANIIERPQNTPVAFVGCDTCVFANNTIIEPQSYIARILEENLAKGPGFDGYFINNLIVFNTADMNGYSYVNVGANTRPQTYTFGWDLWFALDQADFTGPVYRDGVPAEVNAVIQQDPLLLDRVGGNYRVDFNSPAIANGGIVPRDVPADFDRRLYRTPATIGAFASPAEIAVTTIPRTDQVSGGGALVIDVTLTNISNQNQSLIASSEVILSNGSSMPLLGPVAVSLQSGDSINTVLRHSIPRAAPPGMYTYHTLLTKSDGTYIDETEFEFNIE